MSSINRSPPSLSDSKLFNEWLKLIDIWRKFTSLEPEKQGPASVITRRCGVRLELDSDIISGKDGGDKIIARLDKIYKKYELTQKYNVLESFEKYKRKDNATIGNFQTELEKSFHKTRSHDGTMMPDNILAYHLIKSANLTTRDEQLLKATINKLSYDIVKSKLIKIFLEDNEISTADFKELHIRQEPTYHAKNYLYNEVVGLNQEEIFTEEDETTRKSHNRPCILKNKTRNLATEIQGSLQSTEMLIQITTLPIQIK